MGSGRWSPSTYNDRAAARAATGRDAFDYSAAALRSGNLRVHQTLDPQGLGIRESRDSDEHPDSNAIIISLDVTGSMGRVVRGIHADLPRLFEMILGHQYIPHPQILFAAVGDAFCDRIPLQVAQFESDNRMDQHLENMILEGGGGGQKTESYELMLYIAARHTTIDCWEKRRRKGYLFIIGDEMAYNAVNASQINRLIGDGLQADVPLAQIVEEARQRYHLYFVLPGGASHGADTQVIQFWTQLVGEDHLIQLRDPGDVSEAIALAIGLNEGTASAEQGAQHLAQKGIVARAVAGVGKAISSLIPGSTPDDAPKIKPTRRL